MPKIKTNRSAAKRFSFTKSGKAKHKKAFLRHLNSSKGRSRKRHLRRRDAEQNRHGTRAPHGSIQIEFRTNRVPYK